MDTHANTERFKQDVVRLEQRVSHLEKACDHINEEVTKVDALVDTVRVAMSRLEANTKITWTLLLLVIGGLISIAFQMWQAGGTP